MEAGRPSVPFAEAIQMTASAQRKFEIVVRECERVLGLQERMPDVEGTVHVVLRGNLVEFVEQERRRSRPTRKQRLGNDTWACTLP